MKPVSIRQLKARLSEYLRVVRGGETVPVTDRDEVVAERRPTRPGATSPDSLEAVLDSLSERGELTRAAIAKGRWIWKIKGLGVPPGSAAVLLEELRRDR